MTVLMFAPANRAVTSAQTLFPFM